MTNDQIQITKENSDSGEIKVEIVQKQSSRKWVNLSKYGKEFLKKNNIEKLDLGI